MEFLSNLSIAEWAGIIAAWIVAFERLARITPNKTDDKIVSSVRRLFKVLSADFPNVDKITGNEGKK